MGVVFTPQGLARGVAHPVAVAQLGVVLIDCPRDAPPQRVAVVPVDTGIDGGQGQPIFKLLQVAQLPEVGGRGIHNAVVCAKLQNAVRDVFCNQPVLFVTALQRLRGLFERADVVEGDAQQHPLGDLLRQVDR